jgi:peptidoglycan hydrolase-like protein with peptidoglycan-binding domain
MDTQVQKAQQWVNKTYSSVSGYIPCPESGATGWSTMYSLTRALQHELGIAALSDNFGDGTMAAMTAFGSISRSTSNVNVKTIVEAALYCKGYPGGMIDGAFGTSTQSGIVQWKTDMGFSASGTDNAVAPKEIRTLLTMDAYVLLPGGSATVRAIQQWMNTTYMARRDYKLIPCDGYFSRDVQRGLMLAIQYSIGMADGVANGNFGPGTREGLRTKAGLSVGSTDAGSTSFVKLFKAALVFNKVDGVDWPGSTFTTTTSNITRKFQGFCQLPQSGAADYQTWCSLLVSTGDPERSGSACDCMTPLNDARAKAIKAAGYSTVGRYITGGTQKLLTVSEISVILSNGLNFFPIYQEYNNALSYFDEAKGKAQGEMAHASALNLGLPTGAIIYFAVDYDAVADEVLSNIIPFFKGVNDAFEALGNKYSVGIYGSRNICSMVSAVGYAVSSFVSGMSTGFSGNLGYPLPLNWAFDQVQTLTLGAGTVGEIEIDKNIKSNRDPGISSLTKPIDQNAAMFTWIIWLEARALEWWNKGNHTYTQPQLVAHYLRTYLSDRYDNVKFDLVSGPVDHGFTAYCDSSAGRPDPATLRDPASGLLNDIQHLGASIGSVFHHSLHTAVEEVSVVDFGGWAGDLITAAVDTYRSGVTDVNAYTYAYGQIGNSAAQGTFPGPDLIADVDAMVFGLAIRSGRIPKLSGAVQQFYASAAAGHSKYEAFVGDRFKTRASFLAASRAVFTQTSDINFSVLRAGLWQDSVDWIDQPIGVALELHPQLFEGVASAFVDAVYDKYIN